MHMSFNTNMVLYKRIHNQLTYHVLWQLSYLYPDYKSALQLCIRISSRGKISNECNLCNTQTYDYDFHILLHCEHLNDVRNNFFVFMIDLLDVETYVAFELQEDIDMLAFLFGGNNNFSSSIEFSTWENHFKVLTLCTEFGKLSLISFYVMPFSYICNTCLYINSAR